MNTLPGKIKDVSVSGSLSLAHIDVAGNLFSAIVIDTPATSSYLSPGKTVSVIFKETEVIIGTGKEHAVSLQNRLQGKIIEIESGDLLAKIVLDTAAGKVVSVITSQAVKKLGLKEGLEVTALIKTNEIMLTA
ncbi:MAG: TOBE domain-containing protein [Bacteroidales bacterium]|nr:TOBE domain-containing protein [Bacteroidales bacterium]